MYNNFFDILEECNTLPYAMFYHRIKWNVSAIAGYENANGYIVQKVHFVDTTGIIKPCDDYYEAWQVSNGLCIYEEKQKPEINFDDDFSNWSLVNSITIRKSLGKNGEISYETNVYWVDIDCSLYGMVKQWKIGHVKMAGNLKSAFVAECLDFKNITHICSRKFVHKVDFIKLETVERALRKTFELRIQKNDPELKELLEEILAGTKYIELVDKICT